MKMWDHMIIETKDIDTFQRYNAILASFSKIIPYIYTFATWFLFIRISCCTTTTLLLGSHELAKNDDARHCINLIMDGSGKRLLINFVKS